MQARARILFVSEAWFRAFFGAVVGTTALLLGTWAALLLIDPPENRHYEYAVPALVLALAGLVGAVSCYATSSVRAGNPSSL